MLLAKKQNPLNIFNRCKPALGTFVEVALKADKTDDELFAISQKIFNRIEKIEKMMSFHDDESELNYINSNASFHSCLISQEMNEVLTKALELSKLTNGLYDISIASELVKNGFLPDKSIRADKEARWEDIQIKDHKIFFKKRLELDLGGIAKGYAIDQAFLEVQNEEIDIIINAGGDILMNNWQGKSVDIRVPANLGSIVNVNMKNKAVATSASYFFDEEKSPIICPKTKKMLKDNRSISVFAKDCMIADALTKVAFLDSKNTAQILKLFNAKAIIIDEQGNLEDYA